LSINAGETKTVRLRLNLNLTQAFNAEFEIIFQTHVEADNFINASLPESEEEQC